MLIHDEKPAHEVCIGYEFWLGQHEVTQGQWFDVMGANPAHFNQERVGDNWRDYPVERVSWNDVQEFIEKLNAATVETHGRASLQTYRLPSEAEWEYAARAGTTTMYAFGDDVSQLGKYAWYKENSNGRPHPVGQKQPNAWGLHDMHGNVWEWVADTWHSNYDGAPIDGSAWTEGGEGSRRVLRGGGYANNSPLLRCAYRVRSQPRRQVRLQGVPRGARAGRPVDVLDSGLLGSGF
jgi:formylglycine-generating enzyme required for sulfatase activity